MGGVDDIHRLDPYELGDNNIWQPLDNSAKTEINSHDRKNIEPNTISSQVWNKLTMEPNFDDLFKDINIIHQEKNSWLKKMNLQKYTAEHEEELKQLFNTPEWDKLLYEARRNYNSKDIAKQTKSNYILQIYAKYKLQDNEISLDGKWGQQTITTLRYLQSEGIWWEKVQWVTITETQKKKIEEYKKNVVEKAKDIVNPFANNSSSDTKPIETIQNNTSNSHVTVFSEWVPSIANKMQEINEHAITIDWLSQEDPSSFLSDEEKNKVQQETVNTIVSNPKDQKKYLNYIQTANPSIQIDIDPNIVSQINTAIKNTIEKQATGKKEMISKYCKKEAYMTCLEWFENLLNGFHSDPAQIDTWKKDLQSVDPNSVDFSWGNLRMNIGSWMERLSFSYDMYTGIISATQLVDKDPTTGNIWVKNPQPRTLIQNIDPLDVIERSIQGEIVGKDNSILSQFDQIQEQAWFIKNDFINKLTEQEPIISKTVESHYVYKNLLWRLNQLDPSWSYRRDISSNRQNNLYKIYDICYRSIDSYDIWQLQQFKNNLPDLQNIVKQYQQGSIQDAFWDKYLGKQTRDAMPWWFSSQNPEDSWLYLLFKNMVHNTSSPTGDKYHVINLPAMKKMIDYDHASDTHWFGNPSHNILAEIDTHNASIDADKLLESAYT